MKPFAKTFGLDCGLNRSLAISAALLAALALQAQNPNTDRDTERNPGSTTTRPSTGAPDYPAGTEQGVGAAKLIDTTSFIQKAAQANLAEVKLSEIATEKSQNAQVKQFAERMQRDHAAANDKLRPIAERHGVTFPSTLEPKHQAAIDKFQQMSGDQFDKEFAEHMLRDHAKAVSLFQQAAKQTQEADVKQFAQETLPTLQEHLKQAKELAQAVGVDQTTISSIMKHAPEAVGGAETPSGTEKSGEKKDRGEKNGTTTP